MLIHGDMQKMSLQEALDVSRQHRYVVVKYNDQYWFLEKLMDGNKALLWRSPGGGIAIMPPVPASEVEFVRFEAGD